MFSISTYFSLHFLALILLTIVIYALVPSKGKKYVLLISSYVCFFLISGKLLLYLLFSTLSVHHIGLWLQDLQNECKGLTKGLEKEERKKRRLANLKPFKPFSELTEEEKEKQKQICSNGGKTNRQLYKENKTLKETTLRLLNSTINRETALKYVSEDTLNELGNDITMQDVLTARMIQEVLENGNTKAIEFLRDTSGQKPTTELEINADVVTAADRALLDKFRANLVEMHNIKTG